MTRKFETERGVCLIAYGTKAEQAARTCQTSIMDVDSASVALQTQAGFQAPSVYTNAQKARWAKVNLYEWSPFELTCYLDADTIVRGTLDAGFQALRSGWDIALVPSRHQEEDWLWHVTEPERDVTRQRLGHEMLQLQCGVMWFGRSERAQQLFQVWKEEWLHYKGEDQGAFLRALARVPVRAWLLGHPFNGGAVVKHHWGLIR